MPWCPEQEPLSRSCLHGGPGAGGSGAGGLAHVPCAGGAVGPGRSSLLRLRGPCGLLAGARRGAVAAQVAFGLVLRGGRRGPGGGRGLHAVPVLSASAGAAARPRPGRVRGGGPRSPSSEERWRSAPPPAAVTCSVRVGSSSWKQVCGFHRSSRGPGSPCRARGQPVPLACPSPCSVWAAQRPPAPAPLTAVWGPALLRVAPALQGPGPGWALLRPLSLAACSEQSRRQGPPCVPGTKATGCLRPGSRATLGRYSRCRRDPPAALLSGAGARGHARAFAVSGSMNFMMQSPVCLGSSGKPHQPGVATSQGRRAGRPHHTPYPTAGVVATARCS